MIRRQSLSLSFNRRLLLIGNTVLLLEPFDTSSGVNELLSTGKERVTGAADFNIKLLACRFRLKRVPAGAGHGCHFILGMNTLFHTSSSTSYLVSSATVCALTEDCFHLLPFYIIDVFIERRNASLFLVFFILSTRN